MHSIRRIVQIARNRPKTGTYAKRKKRLPGRFFFLIFGSEKWQDMERVRDFSEK